MKISNIIVAATLALSIVLTGCSTNNSNDQKVHEFSSTRVDTNSLKNTVIIPTMDSDIVSGKNMVYCSTFQLAWNELKNGIIKEDIKVQSSPSIVESLNKGVGSKEDISDKDYVAMVGYAKDNIISQINSTLKDKFKDDAPFVEVINLQPTDIFAYSFLYKNLRFKKEFESLKTPIQFKTANGVSEVKGFGVEKYSDKSEHEEFGRQVDIFDYEGSNNFIVRISSESDNDEIILAKVRPESSLQKTVESVSSKISSSSAGKLSKNDTLQIPKFDFNISHSYSELLGKGFRNAGFEDYFILDARQDIMFLLDEKGAVLKSKSKIHSRIKGVEESRSFIFDEPFLMYLKEKDGKHPYLALWVENPELMLRN